MPNVLVRDVPSDDLEQIRVAAADRGVSVQTFLRDALHAQATHLRRRRALARIEDRLGDKPALSERERQAIRDAIDDAHAERAEQLIDRPDS